MRWWIFGGVLAGLALAIAVGGFAGAEGGLRLQLKADRLWCTAGTLINVSWEAEGGERPYRVSVQGEETPSSYVTQRRIECDALPRGEDGELAAHGEMTIRAEAVDAAGARASEEVRVLLAPPLAAPTGLRLAFWNPRYNVNWDPVPGTGSLHEVQSCGRNSLPCGPYVMRYRGVGMDGWRYEHAPPRFGRIPWERSPRGIEEMQIAAMRRPLEGQRPEGLNWSEVTRYAATREFGVIVLNAGPERIDLEWEAIPVQAARLELIGPDGVIAREYEAEPDSFGTHYDSFEGLEPDAEYVLRIVPGEGEEESEDEEGGAELAVRTAPLPEGGLPLRLDLSAGRGSCTAGTETDIDWEAAGGRGPYRVEIAGTSGEGETGTARIACSAGALQAGGGVLGYAPVTVRGSVVDADGAAAAGEFELLAGPPLAPPRVDTPKTGRGGFYVPFWVRASRIDYPSWQVAMRWRARGESEWEYATDRIANGPWGENGLANGWVNSTRDLPEATVFETQVARLRDGREIEHPEALAWSEVALVTTAADPIGLVAESTHDSISLRWGPEMDGLNYIATLSPQPPGEEQQPDTEFGFGQPGWAVGPVPPYEVGWSGLCPDAEYFATVRSDAEAGGEWDAPVGFLIRTEPDPDGAEPAPLFEASAESDRIVLRWHPEGCAEQNNYRYRAYEYGTSDSAAAGYFTRDEDELLIERLASGSAYEVHVWPVDLGAPVGRDFQITISTTEREGEMSPDPPPEFSVRYFYRETWTDADPRSAFEVQKIGSIGEKMELEWYVDGRRVRRVFGDGSGWIFGLQEGWHEFQARKIDREGRATEWSEPVRAATVPLSPWIRSMRYERDFLILTWDEAEEGVPIDRYVVEWRVGDGDWEQAAVGAGGWGAIASAPFVDDEEAHVRLRAVNDDYGEGEPSAEREVPSWRRSWTTGMDARGCGEDGEGRFSFVWIFAGGVAPFRVQARPIHLEAGADGTAEIETVDREGRFEFSCADGMWEQNGNLYAAVAVRNAEYGSSFGRETIHRMRFGNSTAWFDSSDSSERLGQPYGGMPEPGQVTQSVHATHVKWWIGRGPVPDWWFVRTRTAEDEEWVEREMHYGSWPMGWWYVEDLEPGTRYEYAFGRSIPGESQWSEKTGVVTTLGEVTGIAVSEGDDSVVVEWDAQPDAWKYVVRLRGQGRSWWTLRDATEGERERAEFVGAAGQGPYSAEVVTPPKDALGNDEATFQLYQGPH